MRSAIFRSCARSFRCPAWTPSKTPMATEIREIPYSFRASIRSTQMIFLSVIFFFPGDFFQIMYNIHVSAGMSTVILPSFLKRSGKKSAAGPAQDPLPPAAEAAFSPAEEAGCSSGGKRKGRTVSPVLPLVLRRSSVGLLTGRCFLRPPGYSARYFSANNPENPVPYLPMHSGHGDDSRSNRATGDFSYCGSLPDVPG